MSKTEIENRKKKAAQANGSMKWTFIILAVSCTTNKGNNGGELDATEKRRLLDKTLEMFDHAYTSYMKNAYPADELMPLSCKGNGKTIMRKNLVLFFMVRYPMNRESLR